MKTITKIGNYVFPQATLIPVANQKVEFMYRDQVEFAKYGITTEHFANIKNLSNQLSAIMSERQLVKELNKLQAEVNTMRGSLVQLLDYAAITVEFAYGKNSYEYKMFNFEHSRLKNNHAAVLEQAVKVCQYIDEKDAYKSLAFQPDTRTALLDSSLAFAETLSKIGLLNNQRKTATEQRGMLTDKLYRELSRICSAGKRIWQSCSKANYDDYVLSKSVPKRSTKTETAA